MNQPDITPDTNASNQTNSAGKAAWICLIIAWVAFLIPLPGTGIFLGLPLNFVALILGIVAMSKLGAKAGLPQLLCSLLVSPVIYLIGLSLFASIGLGASGILEEAQKRQAEQQGQQIEQTEKPAI